MPVKDPNLPNSSLGNHLSSCVTSLLSQVVTWGHPVTTGLSNIDYFVTSDLYEGKLGGKHGMAWYNMTLSMRLSDTITGTTSISDKRMVVVMPCV